MLKVSTGGTAWHPGSKRLRATLVNRVACLIVGQIPVRQASKYFHVACVKLRGFGFRDGLG